MELFQLVRLAQSRENSRPHERHEDGAAAAENRRADRAKQARHAAGFEFAQFVRRADEQAGHRGDAAAHGIGRASCRERVWTVV